MHNNNNNNTNILVFGLRGQEAGRWGRYTAKGHEARVELATAAGLRVVQGPPALTARLCCRPKITLLNAIK